MKPSLTVGLLLLVAFASRADQAPPVKCTDTDPKTRSVVAGLVVVPRHDDPKVLESVARLGDELVVFVCFMEDFLGEAGAAPKKVTMFLNGRDTGIEPSIVDRATGRLRFRLERNDKNKPQWRELLHEPFFGDDPEVFASVGAGEPLKVSVRKDAKPGTARTADVTFFLDQMRVTEWGVFWILLLTLAVLLFLWLAWKSAIVRDGPDFVNANGVTVHQPFSLARCQMAWWFFLILIGYIAIWLISGDRDTITESLLVLMGISAGTALGSVAISSMSESRVSAARTRLTSEKMALDVSIADLDARLTPLRAAIATARAAGNQPSAADVKLEFDLSRDREALDTRRNDVMSRNVNLIGPIESDWFLNDLLTDENGAIALHRFQIFIWTIVLGLIFTAGIVRDLAMPEFSATLLALMGISASTYIGFKLPSAT